MGNGYFFNSGTNLLGEFCAIERYIGFGICDGRISAGIAKQTTNHAAMAYDNFYILRRTAFDFGRPVQPDIPETLDNTSDLSRYSFYFTAGGLWHVLTQWIKEPDNKRKSPKEVTDFLINCLSGLAWFIESE